MEIKPREIFYYVTQNGKCPFEVWFKSLDLSTQAKIDKRLKRLEFGHFGEYRSLGKGVCELKLDFGPGYRIYFGLEKLNLVILLCGGDKRMQDKDIQRAYDYWKEWKIENRR